MGNICYSVASDSEDVITADERRQQMLEAAEKRKKEQEARGIKDIDKIKQMKRKESETKEITGQASGQLRWQVGK